MVRIVDDVCLYDASIEEAFWHAWDLLETCANNGVVINKGKFQFCSKTVNFAGLSISARGVQPSEKMMSAIQDFPPPSDLTSARAFFGLVNQLQWAYANGPDMAPFRDLVRPGTAFTWDDNLRELFNNCKEKILQQVKEGVVKYDVNRHTCIQTDFSKEGLGYLLLQKYCNCSLDYAPLCCKGGWQLVCAGSRFTKGAESNYAPTEGEALAVAWSLNHAGIFTLGCPRLIVSTDHKPLLGIFNNKPLWEIKNPRIVRLKEKTLSFMFTLKYNKGKWHRGPDALSRISRTENKLSEVLMLFHGDFPAQLNDDDFHAELAIAALDASRESLSIEELRSKTLEDPELSKLESAITRGFPPTHQLTDPQIRQYFNVKDNLWIQDGIIMYKDRLVIPASLRPRVLNLLHSAHQGVDGMRSRATVTIYWPGLNNSIRQTRKNCSTCEKIAPSQRREPLQLLPHAEYPFEQICMDAFEIKGKYYTVVVDRFSNWFLVFYYRVPLQGRHVVDTLRSVFTTYGVAQKVFTDGGLPFQSADVGKFLSEWAVTHVTSSAFYPQANGRAELAVKTAKRLLQENLAPDGSLNCNNISQAFLQYRNTPIKHLGVSPAQILYNRSLRDEILMDPRKLKLDKKLIYAAKQ